MFLKSYKAILKAKNGSIIYVTDPIPCSENAYIDAKEKADEWKLTNYTIEVKSA